MSDDLRNAHLEGGDFFWQGDDTGILLIHGFTATTAEVRLLAERLRQAGYTTAGPLLPGHGTSPQELNQTPWEMWLEKVKHFYEQLQRQCSRIFVAGESMGAVLSLALAAQHPEISGLLLFAPAIKVPNLWLAPVLSLFKDYLEKSGQDDGLPWQGYDVYPTKAMVEMRHLQQHTRKHLASVTQPALVFTGEYDRSISADAAQIVLEGIQSEDKRLIHMSESPHCIILAEELDQVVTHVLDFIDSHDGVSMI